MHESLINRPEDVGRLVLLKKNFTKELKLANSVEDEPEAKKTKLEDDNQVRE